MDLVRDFLDKKVLDRNGRDVGRVDSIILEVEQGRAPRVTAIALGPDVVAHRLAPFLGRWVEGLLHAFGVDEGRPFRVPYGKILGINDSVKIDFAVGETPVAAIEQRLRRWVSALPRSS